MPRRTGEVSEDALDLGGQAIVYLGEPLLEQREIRLIAGGKIRRHEVVLAPEMIIQRALGNAGLQGCRPESEQFAAMVSTGDLDEGVNAWIERRQPVYRGC